MAYIPALRFRWLTPLYDPFVRLTMGDDRLKALLVADTAASPGQRILDVGSGAGTLAMKLAAAYPEATVVGLDGDPAILAIARRQAASAGSRATFVEGLATAPPFPPGSFERVVSTLVFHHLDPAAKRAALARIYELLAPGGAFVVADWGAPLNLWQRLAFLGVQALDGFVTTADHVAGRFPAMIRAAGFVELTLIREVPTVFGTLAYHRAVKPAR